MFILFTAYS